MSGALGLGFRSKTSLSKEGKDDTKASYETDLGFQAAFELGLETGGLEAQLGLEAFIVSGKPIEWEASGDLTVKEPGLLKDLSHLTHTLTTLGTSLYSSGRLVAGQFFQGREESKGRLPRLKAAMAGLQNLPVATMASAMAYYKNTDSEGYEPQFEWGLEFEGKNLKGFSLESTKELEVPELVKTGLAALGTTVGGKTSKSLISKEL